MPYFRKSGYSKKVATPRTPRATPRKNYRKKVPKQSFTQRVQKIIAGNVENKLSAQYNTNFPIMRWPTGQTLPEWNIVRMTDIFDKSQGTNQVTRIGNQIKLKRWIIKGCLHPNQDVNPTDATDQYLRYSFQGYATVYLMRKVDCTTVQSSLTKLFQNGSTYTDPVGSYLDHLLKVNNDSYKVYWRRRFKLGPSATYEGTGGTNRMLNNNEFKLVSDFGIDICKYLGKNHIIKYEDGLDNALVSPQMENLVLAVTWSPPFGAMSAQGTSTQSQSKSFYNMTTAMYYEYEDA